MDSSSYAYLAGIIDGEGWIHIREDSRNGRIQGTLGIGNTSKELIDWIHTNFGGRVQSDNLAYYTSHNGEHVPCKKRYRVMWGSEAASKFLPHLLPFLIVKYNKARCLLDLANASDFTHCGNNDRHEQEQAYKVWVVS